MHANPVPRGWFCARTPEHTGACALVPRWWNLHAWWLQSRRRR